MSSESSSGRKGKGKEVTSEATVENDSSNETSTGQAITQLSKIEAKPPILSTVDMADPTAIAIHVLRVKNTAAQLGFLVYLIDPDTQLSCPADAHIYRRWIIESFECRDVRALLSTPGHGAHPGQLWATSPELLLAGVDLVEIYSTWINNLKWDEATNIASFYATFWLVAQELKHLEEPISSRRLRNLYAKAMPKKYEQLVIAADMNPNITGVQDYILYINKAINRTLTRAMEHERGNDNGMMHTRIGQAQRHSPYRRRPSNNQTKGHEYEVAGRADHYENSTVTRATAEILNEYGCMATHELVDKVGKMIGDYLQFERDENDAEMHAVDDRRRMRTVPPAREIQKQRVEPKTQAGKGISRQPHCSNCGEIGCRAKTCPKPKARCSHPVCQKRGIVDHCDKACFFHNRQLCPPYLLSKRDKLIEEWEQEKQHQNIDYVDEDTDSDNYMQLEDAPNYYFHCMETHHEGENDTLTGSHPPDDKSKVHCIEYLADRSPNEFYDHLMYMAYRLYRRRLIPMHAVMEATLSTLLDYVKHCSPRNTILLEAKGRVDNMGSGQLELLKGTCLATISHAILRTNNKEMISSIIARCLRALSTDEEAKTDNNDASLTLEPADRHHMAIRYSAPPAPPTTGRWYKDRQELAKILAGPPGFSPR